MTTATDTKTCTGCGETKPRSEFYKKNGTGDLVMSRCKECHKAADRERTCRKRARKDGNGPAEETDTDTTSRETPESPGDFAAGSRDNAVTNGQRADNGWPINLGAGHREMLMASGINGLQATLRGYETITDPAKLAALGIAQAARSVPGLLVPYLNKDGAPCAYQYRPDVPRVDDKGKACKYESPHKQRNRLDIPPGVAEHLGDPSVELWFTEGAKKADCAVLRGIATVALLGVNSWRYTNPQGGKVALSEFQEIAFNGRKVVIAFDNDMATNKNVNAAAKALSNFLGGKGAEVWYLDLPTGDDKVGLDDYLMTHSVEELRQLVQPDPPTLSDEKGVRSDPLSNSGATPQQSWSGVVPGVAQLRYILDAVAEEVRNRGLVGEENLAKTLYLIFTSRLLDKQVSAGVKGHSSSGKSYTVETVTKFLPPEAFLAFTAMSQKALIYSPEEYAHRTIVMYEVTAMRENVEDDMTSYFIRTLLSEGRIDYDVTVKDPRTGGMTTNRITKEGPTNLVFTTTKTHVHAENETRVLSLSTDDSSEQTARVLMELADEDDNGGDMEQWHELQRWLGSDSATRRVTIPYAKKLAELVPPVAVRMRRDFGSILSLVRTHAMLHQATRQRDEYGRIIATLDDYTVVRDLVAEAVGQGIGTTVSNTLRETVEAVHEVGGLLKGASAGAIAKHLGIDKSNAGRRLKVASDGDYIENQEQRRGVAAKWVIGKEPLPDAADILPDPAQLDVRVAHCCGGVAPESGSDQQCCGVAAESGGEDMSGGGATYDHDTCSSCGQSMVHPASRARGYCEKCRLNGAAS